jgi:hypothetical protein
MPLAAALANQIETIPAHLGGGEATLTSTTTATAHKESVEVPECPLEALTLLALLPAQSIAYINLGANTPRRASAKKSQLYPYVPRGFTSSCQNQAILCYRRYALNEVLNSHFLIERQVLTNISDHDPVVVFGVFIEALCLQSMLVAFSHKIRIGYAGAVS